MISEAISSGLLASVTALMLVLDSAGSHNDLTGMAAAVRQGDVQRLAPSLAGRVARSSRRNSRTRADRMVQAGCPIKAFRMSVASSLGGAGLRVGSARALGSRVDGTAEG